MLTDVKARQSAPREKAYKLFDARGLYLFISVKGTKSWRLKYRFEGKEYLITLGRYPEVSISEARNLREEFRRQMAEGRDPKHLKKRRKLIGARPDLSFEAVAREWHKCQLPKWTERHKILDCATCNCGQVGRFAPATRFSGFNAHSSPTFLGAPEGRQPLFQF